MIVSSMPRAAASGETSAAVPYSRRRRLEMAKAIPRLALDAVDLYVAGAALLGRLGPASGALTVGLAGAHGVVGATRTIHNMCVDDRVYTEMEKRRNYSDAVGDLLTAAGFVGISAGMGVWALPLIAVGELTSNYAQFA
ncbi:MAG: hypothetical protein HY319_12475 [Armatimonadetes bacterium]|nr:hypothetical protein [Armatimonadota bacterium]